MVRALLLAALLSLASAGGAAAQTDEIERIRGFISGKKFVLHSNRGGVYGRSEAGPLFCLDYPIRFSEDQIVMQCPGSRLVVARYTLAPATGARVTLTIRNEDQEKLLLASIDRSNKFVLREFASEINQQVREWTYVQSE